MSDILHLNFSNPGADVSAGLFAAFGHGPNPGDRPGPSCPCKCPPTNAPTPSDGACTLYIGGTWSYQCGGINVGGQFAVPISIPDRDCSAIDVEIALAGFHGIAGGGGGAIPAPAPAVVSTANCNLEINITDVEVGQTATDAQDPLFDTAPAVAATSQAAGAVRPPGNVSPVAFAAAAFGNLGLINGESGNSGDTPADTALMVATMATFDQTEADLASVFATTSGQGASLGITGDIALLQQVDSRLEAVTNAENLLFGGDANWSNTTQSATLQQWITDFFTDAQSSADGGQISAAETTQLLATTLPSSVSISEAQSSSIAGTEPCSTGAKASSPLGRCLSGRAPISSTSGRSRPPSTRP